MKIKRRSAKTARLLGGLRQIRMDAGLTQKKVARKLSTYSTFVSKIESGERHLEVLELAEFCRLYKVKLADFLESVGIG